MQHGGPEIGKPGRGHRLLDRVDPVIAERHLIKSRRIGWKQSADELVHEFGEPVMAMRVPHAEQVTSSGLQHPIGFAVGLVLVRKKHHAELAHQHIECAIGKGQGDRVGRLKFDRLARLELGARHFDHRRVEVGRHQLRTRWQQIAQASRDNPGPGAGFERPVRSERGDPSRHLLGEIGKQDRPKAAIVILGNAADETRCLIAHVCPLLQPSGGDARPLEVAVEMPFAALVALLEKPAVAAFRIGQDFPAIVVGIPKEEAVSAVL